MNIDFAVLKHVPLNSECRMIKIVGRRIVTYIAQGYAAPSSFKVLVSSGHGDGKGDGVILGTISMTSAHTAHMLMAPALMAVISGRDSLVHAQRELKPMSKLSVP